jgi:hypothetical protein
LLDKLILDGSAVAPGRNVFRFADVEVVESVNTFQKLEYTIIIITVFECMGNKYPDWITF